ncbi:MAG: primosomal protein N', partial [Abditibacteriaceae bacterium]
MTNLPNTQNSFPYALIEIDRSFAVAGQGFTYAVPERLRGEVQIGHAVHVPFGRKVVTGYVTGFTDQLDFDASKLKPIASIVSALPVFNEMGLRLARWMSAYYHTPLNECLACLMPHGWQYATVKKYFYTGGDYIPDEIRRSPRQLQIALMLQKQTEPQTIKTIENHLGQKNLIATLQKLVDANILGEINEFTAPKMKPKMVKAARLTKAMAVDDPQREVLFAMAHKQGEMYRRLEAKSTFDTIPLVQLGGALSTWRGLEEKKLIELTTVEVQRRPESAAPLAGQTPGTLMPQQQDAVNVISAALEEKKATTILLHGVTASGKTEVYLAAIEKCLKAGKRALVLVPEIALTAQTVDIFQRRFGEKVAILHSALGGGERFDEWRRVRAGEADIVVGARSAVFAPCNNLGLIIIDEEHDGSYKQDNTPRYHARTVATRRANLEKAVLVLGSATPCMESFLAARQKKFTLVEMPLRVEGRALPKVEIVDMTSSVKGGEMPILSERLKDEIIATLGQNKQVILFLNRRGFATYVQCVGCGHVEQCPNCDISLTYHR